MGLFELTVGLTAFALVLAALSVRLAVPYPSVLVIGGLLLGFVPGTPEVDINPALAFALFLPLVLFDAAYSTTWRDLRDNWKPILSLSVLLVLATTAAVAVVVRWFVPDMPWTIALALGAIVAPPDAAAATAVFQRLKLPRRLITVLQAESLLNDASALIIYRFAIVAAVSGNFSAGEAVGTFVYIAIASGVLGTLLGLLMVRTAPLLRDGITINVFGMMLVFTAYAIAERMHLSGVLTVVAVGVSFFWNQRGATPETRITAFALWDSVIFLLNALAFVLIGLQLRGIWDELRNYPAELLVGSTLGVVGTVILVRLVWVLGYTGLVRKRLQWSRQRDTDHATPSWPVGLVVGWSGMRGLVSLAAALALPLRIEGGERFPYRDLVLFISFAVIFGTLVLQGLTLGPLIRLLGLSDGGESAREERLARYEAAAAALEELRRLHRDGSLPKAMLDEMCEEYELQRKAASPDDAERGDIGKTEDDDLRVQVRLAVIEAERAALMRLRKLGKIGDEPAHRIETELDHSEIMLKRAAEERGVGWLDRVGRPMAG